MYRSVFYKTHRASQFLSCYNNFSKTHRIAAFLQCCNNFSKTRRVAAIFVLLQMYFRVAVAFELLHTRRIQEDKLLNLLKLNLPPHFAAPFIIAIAKVCNRHRENRTKAHNAVNFLHGFNFSIPTGVFEHFSILI